MSSSSSSDSSFEDFERISNPDVESVPGSPAPREESPVLVDAQEDVERSETQRLRDMIESLQDRVMAQDDLIFETSAENEKIKEDRAKMEAELQKLHDEKVDNSVLVSTLLGQLEEEKAKQEEIEREKQRIEGLLAENQQLKDAVEKLEKLSLEEKVENKTEIGQNLAEIGQNLAENGQNLADNGQNLAENGQNLAENGQNLAENGQNLAAQVKNEEPQVVDGSFITQIGYLNYPGLWPLNYTPQASLHVYQQLFIENLNAQLVDKDQQIAQLKQDLAERDARKAEIKAKKEEKKRLKRGFEYTAFGNPYEPAYKTSKQLEDQLELADQQIGIIVEHNDYLRTVEANEHSQELARLREENDQLNKTILFLKQQVSN